MTASRTSRTSRTPGEDGVIPAYRWRCAPLGLATRRQLRAVGLRPGGQDPVAEIVWRRGRRTAHLYRVDQAAPVRPMTPGRVRALAAAMRARRTCPDCGRDAGYVIPRSLGCCWPCSGEAAHAVS
ncbi:RRQRL motif-containing zinc-binding protein [Streptomyces sp. NPDC001380]|uniref:RRQRL motif-containing zinc-binding protein n=1 Tax=Streptomyces sp. NPDC001380 TaxID=3364566 RepID=UPI00367CA274